MKYRCKFPRAVCGFVLLAFLATGACATSMPNWISEYEKKPPPKAVAIAETGSGRWAGYMTYGQPNVHVARAKALEGCRRQAQKNNVRATCEIRLSAASRGRDSGVAAYVECWIGGDVLYMKPNDCIRQGGRISSQSASRQPPVTTSLPATTPPPTATRPTPVPSKLVRDVQESLSKLGYSPGAVDGLLGPNTIAAVKAFQRDLEVTPTGAVSEELLFALNVVVAVREAGEPTETQAELKLISSGSGFLVNNTGYALTNHHVIEDCTAVAVVIDGESQQVKLAATDESNDLALLKLPGTYPNVAQFRESRSAVLGESVLVAGYPLRGILAKRLNVGTGEVSSLAGIGDDARLLQISAPVQPGNSGGPLLDKSATIIGVVVGKLSLKVAKITGDIPENVNFAIKGVIARGFLDIHGIEYDTSRASNVLDTTKIAAAARKFTVPVECWK